MRNKEDSARTGQVLETNDLELISFTDSKSVETFYRHQAS